MITLDLPQEVEARLKNLALRTGQTESSLIIEAIVTRLDDFEDLYLAERRMQELLDGKSTTVPIDEVIARLTQ